MRLFTPKITDALVVIGLAGFVILYSLSAWQASNTPENMILNSSCQCYCVNSLFN